MYELDKVSDETHDGEPYGDGSAELDVFCSMQGIRISQGCYTVDLRFAARRDLPFWVGLVHRLMNYEPA